MDKDYNYILAQADTLVKNSVQSNHGANAAVFSPIFRVCGLYGRACDPFACACSCLSLPFLEFP